jgi:hypothetical protein
MKDVIVLIIAAIVFFLIFNQRQTTSRYAVDDIEQGAPVPPNIVQAIIEKVQSVKSDYVPIDTVFVNIQPDGSYKSRMLFYDTKNFLGTQFDVDASVGSDGSVSIKNLGDSSTVDPSTGYQPDLYQSWSEVQNNLSAQFQGALKGYKKQPPQPSLQNIPLAYDDHMIMSQSNLMTRS